MNFLVTPFTASGAAQAHVSKYYRGCIAIARYPYSAIVEGRGHLFGLMVGRLGRFTSGRADTGLAMVYINTLLFTRMHVTRNPAKRDDVAHIDNGKARAEIRSKRHADVHKLVLNLSCNINATGLIHQPGPSSGF